jgi:hypothetical protein
MISSQFSFRSCIFVAIIVLSSVAGALAQTVPERVLLIASCASEQECGDVTIHRFVFQAGKLISQDVVQKLVTDKATSPFHAGENRIIHNRYLVCFTGAVFDLKTKTFHADEVGAYRGVDGNDLFIDQMKFIDPLSGLTYRLDLETKKYARHTRPNFYSIFGAPLGPISPDGKRTVSNDSISGSLSVLTKKGRNPSEYSKSLIATGYTATCRKCPSNIMYNVPSVWIDNERFLTQRKTGDLVLFDSATKKWTDVVKIPHADEGGNPTFFSDPAGGIYYEADKLYKIDVANKQFSEATDYGLGHGFKVAGRHDAKLFSYEDQKLALLTSGRYVATERYLAVEFQERPLNESFPIGIRVWGKDVGSWTTLKIKYWPRIIGWLDE